MRRTLRARIAMVAAALAAGGCSGKDGSVGPEGPPGPQGPPGPGDPAPIRFAMLSNDNNRERVGLALFTQGGFVSGSTYVAYDMGAPPPLADLADVDVVAAWTYGSAPANAAAIGDLLADYVDAGGRLVLMQTAFTTGYELEGRIMTDGYSPWSASDATGNAGTRMIDPESVGAWPPDVFGIPPHPVFRGINPFTWSVPAFSYHSAPAPLGGSVEVARYTNGDAAIAVNASDTVIALNFFPQFFEAPEMQMLANGVRFVAGQL